MCEEIAVLISRRTRQPWPDTMPDDTAIVAAHRLGPSGGFSQLASPAGEAVALVRARRLWGCRVDDRWGAGGRRRRASKLARDLGLAVPRWRKA